jgi:ketosteroid isomerase-like protein
LAGTPQETIRAAVEAYIAGDHDRLYQQLAEDARVLGSEQRDTWRGREQALRGVEAELQRRRTLTRSVGGSLLERAQAAEGLQEVGDVAWWTTTGDLSVDGSYHREASWTLILVCGGDGDWKIAHSHFSIHR